MILLLSTWTSGYIFEEVEWAIVVLDLKTIDKYLNRIAQAKRIHSKERAAFFDIRYWDGSPTWWGCSEAWEELYTDSVQIVSWLTRSESPPLYTSCTTLVVTTEGIAWETTLKYSPGTAGTDVVTVEVLVELKAKLLAERRTGRPTV